MSQDRGPRHKRPGARHIIFYLAISITGYKTEDYPGSSDRIKVTGAAGIGHLFE